ncbi:MAG: protein-L-isoaspartate(D-aspartate) O-methyltransferase [Gammaproteobacteria bacterium]|nr:protein-L-isoaspartate(D-aspartate) O-methyltransferase [Gammaproteobacteria bacterium]
MAINPMLKQGVGMTSQRTRDRLVERLKEKGIRHPEVLRAIRETPRHLFVDEALSHRAYEDDALPISNGQTISQPYIVARMTEVLLEDGIPDKVLEIGTGSGYQAAILAAIVPRVFSVERIRALLVQAKQRFRQLKLNNIMAKHSDGSWGWSQSAPFDAIIVTAAPEVVPQELLDQLAEGGRMVIPVGKGRDIQELQYIKRTPEGFETRTLEAVSFVPFCAGKV